MSLCTGLHGQETIQFNDLYISQQLDSLTINAVSCGTITGMYLYFGTGFLTNTFVDASLLISQTPELISGTPTGRSVLSVTISNSSVSISDFNTVVVVRLKNDYDDGISTEQESTKAIASYAGIYPCLINTISRIDSGCNECKAFNNVLMIWMLIDITNTYFQYDRISEGVDSYAKILEICIENSIIFSGRPLPEFSGYACGQYGGIGCWIIDSTFVVGQPYILP